MRGLQWSLSYMPKTTAAKSPLTETVAAAPARAAKTSPTRTKAPKTAPVVAVASKSRVKTVKHSKAATPALPATPALSAHEQISLIAYGYWEARGFQPGSPEQDWLRAEQEFLLRG